MKTGYHVTFSVHSKTILRHGIRPNMPSNWRRKTGGEFQTEGLVFFTTDKDAAISWAGHTQWEFRNDLNKAPEFCVVMIHEFQIPEGSYMPDPHRGLHSGSEHWFCTTQTIKTITASYEVTTDMVREMIKRRSAPAL
jgi:hypothetical protein